MVKQQRPDQPEKLSEVAMFLPGQPTCFEPLCIELLISVISRERSIAVYLAKHDIDVLGMDYAWALVPVDADFGFMREWGVDRDVAHAQVALSFARSTRRTGEALYVSGLSRGGARPR